MISAELRAFRLSSYSLLRADQIECWCDTFSHLEKHCDTFSHLEKWISCRLAATAPGPCWKIHNVAPFILLSFTNLSQKVQKRILRLLQTSIQDNRRTDWPFYSWQIRLIMNNVWLGVLDTKQWKYYEIGDFTFSCHVSSFSKFQQSVCHFCDIKNASFSFVDVFD